MATRVYKNAYFLLNAVDMSAHIASVSITTSKDTPEDTAMGDDSRSFQASGLRNATIDVEFNSDDAAGAVSATLWTIYTGSAAVAFQLNPDGSSTGVTNPEYTGSCILTSDVPLGGSVGDTQKTSVSLQVTGDVTRSTT